MHRIANRLAAFATILGAVVATAEAAAQAQAQAPAPMIKQDTARKVAAHTYVILDDNVGFVPNVGIVVGERATLIVDTGMANRQRRDRARGGAQARRQHRVLSDRDALSSRARLRRDGVPGDAKWFAGAAQQAETDEQGAQTIERFSSFSPAVADLLAKASFCASPTPCSTTS